MDFVIDERGYYGNFGGAFIAEMLRPNIEELTAAYRAIVPSDDFREEYGNLLRSFVGRPTPLFEAERLSRFYGTRILLKREDLAHTGSHKINNAIGQGLLAKRMGKKRIIAETGAGQHGVATASVCALLGLECVVYMGATDIRRQALNVERMRLLGADVRAVTAGSQVLKDATNEAMRDWMAHPHDTHYIIGSAVGPHPYPALVTYFQCVIGNEIQEQCAALSCPMVPDVVIACIGGGSNAAGAFTDFLSTPTKLIGVEAAGCGVESGQTAASLSCGRVGVLHGSQTVFLQDGDGQVQEAHSISAGLDYPGIGPLHAHLHQLGRVHYCSVTDSEALHAGQKLACMEGIIPALESAHAVAYLEKAQFDPGTRIVVVLSGRGDKDMPAYMDYQERSNGE